jgi:MFS family permease
VKEKRILYLIIAAQFCGTALWFAGNAALPQLILDFQWEASSLGYLTTAVQLGFIAGTLLFAITGITDRFSPARVFFVSCLLGALANLLAVQELSSFSLVLWSRFVTGFFLAGIYPVGMKIAADWKKEGLGNWLGWLVGALVLGTAFPHLLRAFPVIQDVKVMLTVVSLLAVGGGTLVLVGVPDGPFRKRGTVFSFKAVVTAFSMSSFRTPALGYFGHMWELYAFWAFIPSVINYFNLQQAQSLNVSLITFFSIGIGAIGCGLGGILSKRIGSERVALFALATSGACCILSPLIYEMPPWLFFSFLFMWGAMVIADSPQFSSLVALGATPEMRGSAITIVTCIGFSITVLSIQLLNQLSPLIGEQFLFWLLIPGPSVGLVVFLRKKKLPKN